MISSKNIKLLNCLIANAHLYLQGMSYMFTFSDWINVWIKLKKFIT